MFLWLQGIISSRGMTGSNLCFRKMSGRYAAGKLFGTAGGGCIGERMQSEKLEKKLL